MSGKEMKTCDAELIKVFWASDENNFSICRFVHNEKGIEFTAKGVVYPRVVGFNYRITGKFEWNKRYEEYQFSIQDCELLSSASLQGIVNYLTREGPNVGEIRAKEIVEEFGEQTLEVIEQEPKRLVGKVKGFTLARAEILKEWIAAEKKLSSVKKMLYEIGLTKYQVEKFIAHFGSDAANKVRKECFTLISVDGIGFLTVCKIADKIGIPAADPHRVREGIRYAVSTLMQEGGHVCVNWHDLVAESCRLLSVSRQVVIEQTKKLLDEGQLCKEDSDPHRFTRHPELFDELSRKE